MRDLRGAADDHDLVLKKSAVVVIRVPEFGIENFVEWLRRISVVGAETEEVCLVIPRNIGAVAELRKPASGERLVELPRSGFGSGTGELPIGQA